ncbi:MAG TPA: queuine tRNA-ribosyltransferase [Legionella sp.]|nr:queuine tRNA-ribosyltransferase [Legionella sp.]
MLNKKLQYVPVLSSEAGLCLTPTNWEEVNTTVVTSYLDNLLIKPGFECLQQISDLKSYLNWSGELILNATRLKANKEGLFSLTSPFDGSKTKYSMLQLLEIINSLKVDKVLLPANIIKEDGIFWNHFNTHSMPFFSIDDFVAPDTQKSYGLYAQLKSLNESPLSLEKLEKWAHVPRYLIGDFDPKQFRNFSSFDYLESNIPANKAIKGIVYGEKGEIDVTDEAMQFQFEIIISDCGCPTCTQKFTKAYLHHLYLHTPLLCHRLLIQHNVYQAQICH